MSSAMLSTGGMQIFCGFVLILCDIICMAMLYGISVISYMGLIFGIFYIITGSLGVAGGKAGQSGGSARGLAIAALVMSILSILNSFALIIYVGFALAILALGEVIAFAIIVGIQMVFFIIMFITSIVMCVFAVRVMSSARTTTHVTQVTHVVGHQGVGYAGGPQPYPAGQQGQYAAPYPQKV